MCRNQSIKPIICFLFFLLFSILFLLNGWLVGFYGISTFVGYLVPNPFLYK